ncbi:hypothetical protein M3Y94_00817600 [Aphelenchoides besseyi]|nr:hypothetical protein M3Y94_00817600 [Aphelenchoides besseyi]KAI6227149.1 hypothetical protein M3Y95_00696100 [Aphelenchoides besseyi]
MGSGSSHHHNEPPLRNTMDNMPVNFPDINHIVFNGIPKMMQVADDMHVMTQAIVDLKNLTILAGCVSVVGIGLFLLLKFMSVRRNRVRRRRKFQNHMDSERSSLNRTYRQYTQKPLDWNHNKFEHKVDLEKLILEHSSSSHGSQSQQHTPPAVNSKRNAIDYHQVERTPPPTSGQTIPNGTVLKRLDPVKLVIDDVPYVDN